MLHFNTGLPLHCSCVMALFFLSQWLALIHLLSILWINKTSADATFAWNAAWTIPLAAVCLCLQSLQRSTWGSTALFLKLLSFFWNKLILWLIYSPYVLGSNHGTLSIVQCCVDLFCGHPYESTVASAVSFTSVSIQSRKRIVMYKPWWDAISVLRFHDEALLYSPRIILIYF